MNRTRVGSRWKKHVWFLSLLGIVAFLTYLQWIFLFSQRGRVLISRIQHAEVLIPGWEPFKNMQTRTYIRPNNETTILTGENVCPQDQPPNVMVVVASAVENIEQRLAIRHTWAKDSYQRYNVSVAFMLGVSLDEETNIAVKNENYLYKDLIVEDFVDNRYNVTVKSAFMLKWTLRHCKGANFLMKTEDDVFLNVAKLDKFVHNPSRIRPKLLVGKLIPTDNVSRNSLNERYMPKYMYPHDTYPDYLSGVGYLMAKETVPLLYEGALRSSIVHLEDVFITGICAESAQITRYYDFRFYYVEGLNYELDCEILYQQNLIVHSHKVTAETMYRDNEKLHACMAEQESKKALEPPKTGGYTRDSKKDIPHSQT